MVCFRAIPIYYIIMCIFLLIIIMLITYDSTRRQWIYAILLSRRNCSMSFFYVWRVLTSFVCFICAFFMLGFQDKYSFKKQRCAAVIKRGNGDTASTLSFLLTLHVQCKNKIMIKKIINSISFCKMSENENNIFLYCY